MLTIIPVAAAALKNRQGEILLAQRPPGVHQGGLWEFPGGKIEAGETPFQALKRELREELGIEPLQARPLIVVPHDYGDRRVVLRTWLVEAWRGEPRGREGQPLAWVPLSQLASFPMPAADRPILKALELPSAYAITPPEAGEPDEFLRQLEKTLQAGTKLVQFRVFDQAPPAWRRLARQARSLCDRYQACLMINASPSQAREAGGHGVHLNSHRLAAMTSLGDCGDLQVGASCHDAAQLQKASRLGVDFAVLSPVLPTASHPRATPLGWEGFERLVTEAALPVYALGGMQPEMLQRAWQAGGQGIAAIRGLWRGH